MLLLSSTAYSQQSKDGLNLVLSSGWGGGWYNSSAERWEGNGFKPSSLGEYSKYESNSLKHILR
jgi:hypothetical protein